MKLGRPQRPGIGDRPIRGFEADQAELAGTGRSAVFVVRGLDIIGIAPKPFPGEQRTVGAEKRRISRGVAPVRQ